MRHSAKRPPCRTALIVFLTASVALVEGCSRSEAAGEGKAPVPVAVAIAMRGAQPYQITGIGRLQGLNTAVVRAQTTGQIVSVGFAEGQGVQAGQPLAQIDPRPLRAQLAQDTAAWRRDLAALADARDNLGRSSPLVAQGLATAQQVEQYRSQVAQLSAAVAGDRALMEHDRLTLAYTSVRAPFAGVAGVRQVDAGNLVSPGDANGIVTIVQVQPITMLFTLPQSAIGPVRSAMAAAGVAGVPVAAIAQGDGRVIDSGRLLAVDNHIDDGSGTITVKAIFPNAQKQLWPGQQASARVVLGNRPAAVTIPASALQANSKGTYVWIVGPAGRARMQPIVAGDRLGKLVVITRGLTGGERVVTDGQFDLVPGATVRILRTGPAATPLKSDNSDRLGITE